MEQIEQILKKISQLRRAEQQNFQSSSLAPDVPVVERQLVPSIEVLEKMFPDEDIEAWEAATDITAASVKGLKDLIAAETMLRERKKEMIRTERMKFNVASSTSRRKREATNSAAPRKEAPMVLSESNGYGIKKGETSELSGAILCHSCGVPQRRVRKILETSEAWNPTLADVKSSEFLAKKLEVEEIVDSIFESALLSSTPLSDTNIFDYEDGYYGSVLISSWDLQAGVGRRKRETQGTGLEVEVATKTSTISAEDLDLIFETGKSLMTTLTSSSSFSESVCSVALLKNHYDSTVLKLSGGLRDSDTVSVGLKAHFECQADQTIMNRTIDPENDGFDVMCGNGGAWEEPDTWPDKETGCVLTPMCPQPSDSDIEGTMTLLPYNPIDTKGSVPEGESVYYHCNEDSALLDDDSGTAVFELKCEKQIDSAEKPSFVAIWPSCLAQPRCTSIPSPDSTAKFSGLELDPDTREVLLPGEFAVYNCTDEYNTVTTTGGFFSIECVDGLLDTPGDGLWPECREPASCDTTPEGLPMPPADPPTYLLPDIPEDPVLEMETITYKCLAHPNKTFISTIPGNLFNLTCMPGPKWDTVEVWPICLDTTTTTAAPTTSTPPMKKKCYCLGDLERVPNDDWVMTVDRHKAILQVCRDPPQGSPFSDVMVQKDWDNNEIFVPIKEMCGVTQPYVREYGALFGTQREYSHSDTCLCPLRKQDSGGNYVVDKVVGYWVTLDILSQKWKDNLKNLENSRTAKQLASHIEEVFDALYLDGGLLTERFIRTRVMRFMVGEMVTNQDELDLDPTAEQEFSVKVTMEVQFSQPNGQTVIPLSTFSSTSWTLISENTTLSELVLNSGTGLVISTNCTSCNTEDPLLCINDDFSALPDYLTHQYVKVEDGVKQPFPYNVTEGGVTKVFSLPVGATIDIVCDDENNVKKYQSDDPSLADDVLTIVCKPDKYYSVPKVWPVCKAQCPELKPRPGNGTRLILDEEHRAMVGKLDKKFWEDEVLYYKCEDERNEGVVTNKLLIDPITGGPVGDKRQTTLEYKCTGDGTYNTPLVFKSCAPKPDNCECLGDMTPEQSLTVLDMICYDDQFEEGNYHYASHMDMEGVGQVLMANKTRCGVKKADYPTLEDKCHCLQMDLEGVKTGFWHIMEVLTLPWHEDLFYPNTSMFQDAKRHLEKELDLMYIQNSTSIFGRRYVRSVVMKFLKGKYKMEHLTSSTSTTTTSTTTSTTTTKPKRLGRRKREDFLLPNDMRDYVIDYEEAWREDGIRFIGAVGSWIEEYQDEYSTTAWVEHQFMEDFSVQEFDPTDFMYEHQDLLMERNGQWMDETGNNSLWLSQGCYESSKCQVYDMARCENVILSNLPRGFTHEKPMKKVQIMKDLEDAKEEYRLPVGAELNIVCKDKHQKITVDEWDSDHHDMKMTVTCMPTFKYDLPQENFPKCRSYCPAPQLLWNQTTMMRALLPLQEEYIAANPTGDLGIPATHPDIGYRQLQPNDYAGLTIDTSQSDPGVELWEGEKIFFVCTNNSLGVEKGASPVVAFKCRSDGVYAVPKNLTWPECDVRTTTAKPPIVNAVKISMNVMDDGLINSILFADVMANKNASDENLFMTVCVPTAIIILILVIGCLFFTRHDSICCQVCNRDYEIKQMQNYGHQDYHYE